MMEGHLAHHSWSYYLPPEISQSLNLSQAHTGNVMLISKV